LILTTFDLDEYVFEALRAGASGFVLKDDSPEQLIAAIRTVADGDALLSPTITGRVIQRFVRTSRPAPPKELGELSERERDVFRPLAKGLSNAEIGSYRLPDVLVYAVVDDALAPDFPLGVELDVFIRRETQSGSWPRCAATSPRSRLSSGSRSGS
jgi:hypothetical protein